MPAVLGLLLILLFKPFSDCFLVVTSMTHVVFDFSTKRDKHSKIFERVSIFYRLCKKIRKQYIYIHLWHCFLKMKFGLRSAIHLHCDVCKSVDNLLNSGQCDLGEHVAPPKLVADRKVEICELVHISRCIYAK